MIAYNIWLLHIFTQQPNKKEGRKSSNQPDAEQRVKIQNELHRFTFGC